MSDLSAFHGPNAGYVLDLYDRYLQDPNSVDPDTRATFERVDPAEVEALAAARPRSGAPPVATAAPTGPIYDVSAVVGAAALAQAIRDYGHLDVQLDPLGTPPHGAPELHPTFYGLTEAQLAALPVESIPWPANPDATNAREAIDNLRRIYSGGIGYDFDQVQIAEERAWLREAVESGHYTANLSPEAKTKLLKRLTEVEGFERFLHQTYLGQKRFSIEGTDALVPMLDTIIRDAAAAGVREVVLGMAHRGRLNVLAHILGKPYAAIIAAFEGSKARSASPSDSSSDNGVTGDVKYHLGARRAKAADGDRRGAARAGAEPEPPRIRQSGRGGDDPRLAGRLRQPGPPPQDCNRAMAILLHGDAAFPGQGIVAETLNFSGLPGYSTGGTIHIIVNNQVGFTTDIRDSRSTLYAGDLAKGFEIPVVHVNADDPLSCLSVARMAVDLPAAVRQGLPDRSRRLPSLGPQRGRRADLHPTADVRDRHPAIRPCVSALPTSWSRRAPSPPKQRPGCCRRHWTASPPRASRSSIPAASPFPSTRTGNTISPRLSRRASRRTT